MIFWLWNSVFLGCCFFVHCAVIFTDTLMLCVGKITFLPVDCMLPPNTSRTFLLVFWWSRKALPKHNWLVMPLEPRRKLCWCKKHHTVLPNLESVAGLKSSGKESQGCCGCHVLQLCPPPWVFFCLEGYTTVSLLGTKAACDAPTSVSLFSGYLEFYYA